MSEMRLTVMFSQGIVLFGQRCEYLNQITTATFRNPASVVFSPHGEGKVVLTPGKYYAVASMGIEYELDISEPFEINKQNKLELDFQVIRSVDTTGWISADFHVHSDPSHDSGVRPADRVTTMAAEGVEYFTPTDHDYISDFDPVVQSLGLNIGLMKLQERSCQEPVVTPGFLVV